MNGKNKAEKIKGEEVF